MKFNTSSGPAWGLLFVGLLTALLLVVLSWRLLFFQGLLPVDGNMMRMGYPNWALCTADVTSRTSLLWNPFRNMGEPFLADPQTMAGYPVQWILSAAKMSFINFMRCWILIHTGLAALFMGLLAWRWFRDPWASVVAALLAGLNGFFLSHGSLPNHLASAAYLPMVLYFTYQRSPLLLGVALALQWLAGFPPFSLLTGILSLCLSFFQGPRGFVAWAKGSAIGFCLGAFQIIPFLEFIRLSTRSLALGGIAAIEYSQPLGQLLKVWLLPQWFALSPDVVGDQAIVSSYVGPVALGLALVGIYKGQKMEKVLGVLLAISLLLCLGQSLPGYQHASILHLFRFPANWMLISVACLTLLAASGIFHLQSRPMLKIIAAGLLAADLVAFAQYVRVPWVPPALLQEVPPLAQHLLSQPFPTRLYHPPFLTEGFTRQSGGNADAYIFMKESLMPSHGMALGVREVKSYQVLTLKSADRYQQRLFTEGVHSSLAQWAGISNVVTLRKGAEQVGPGSTVILPLESPEKPVFIFNRQAGDRVEAIQQKPGSCEVDVLCASPSCLLVFSEMDYPGWRVLIDGAPVARGEPFEQAFLTAQVHSGRHHVAFEFQSRSFQLGRLLSVFVLGLIFLGFFKGRLWKPAVKASKPPK